MVENTLRWLRMLSGYCLQPQHWLKLTLAFNLPFIFFKTQRLAYDTYSHIFFADHYRQTWWSLWEPRWYLGFSVASYPPLVHQLIALLSWPINALIAFFAPQPEPYPGAFRWASEEAAYVVILVGVLCAYPFAMRRFARLFVGEGAARWAGALTIGLSALSLTAWSFGQLPTLAATLIILLALERGGKFLLGGEGWALGQAVLLAGLAGATHHGVFLWVPFAGGAVVVRALQQRRNQSLSSILTRTCVWGLGSGLLIAATLWPFLAWSRGQSLQTPIDHASRYNFFQQPQALFFFFWPVYGALLLTLPFALWFAGRMRRLQALGVIWGILFVLSLGGTTPLPRWFFGTSWEWLTYDRFGLWASLTLLPIIGAVFQYMSRPSATARSILSFFLCVAFGLAQISGWFTLLTHAQPEAIELMPIITFLNAPAQQPYRYLTLGFGDQLVKLSTLTSNGTLDGTYHTARTLPELRASGLGALDGAVWNPQGVWALQPYLGHPERYGVRWVFSNHTDYEPILRATGWQFRAYVSSVQAWEHPEVRPVSSAPPGPDLLAAVWWGSAPCLLLLLVLFSALWPMREVWGTRPFVIQGLVRLRQILWCATFGLLSVWWIHVGRSGLYQLTDVYFTYDSVLIYASDVALSLALGIWLAERGLRRETVWWGPRPILLGGGALGVACMLSLWRSPDPALTLALGAHLLLLGGLYVMLINEPASQWQLGKLAGGVILIQTVIAISEVTSQSTLILQDWPMLWPGVFTATTRGVSVVLNAQGERWLRAYGTLPHPNILGALLVIYLGAVLGQYWQTPHRKWLLLLSAGVFTLGLTFSRGAWLGALGLSVAWLWFAPSAERPRVFKILVWGGLVFLLALLPLIAYLPGRLDLSGQANPLEYASIADRWVLLNFSGQLWLTAPFTGVGAGTFVIWSARLNEFLPKHPVHNVPLLILVETGLGGALALLGVFAFIIRHCLRRRSQMSMAEAVWSAALCGLFITSLFDHLWWTQAPARVLMVIALSHWVDSAKTFKNL